MAITLYLVFGFVLAALCRAIQPGRQTIDPISLALMGIAGCYSGGLIGAAIAGADATVLHSAGILGALVGGLLLLGFARVITDHHRHARA
jgi:uncharacterized membrane protein YeaQ/YmgE (transglycosylase-associated protein family)